MNTDSFVHFILENFSPTGIVYSTSKAKNIISKNNISPAEFLRPFGIIPKLTYNTEFSSFVISDFRIDFYDSEYYQKIPQNDYSTIINRILSSEKYIPKITEIDLNSINVNDKMKLTDRIIDKLNGFSFPWFSTYIKAIIELIKFNEYELYQQPICNIYICSIYDNPNNIMPKISDKGKIPSLIYERIYEPDMPVLIIIINDKSDELMLLYKMIKKGDKDFIKSLNDINKNWIALENIVVNSSKELLDLYNLYKKDTTKLEKLVDDYRWKYGIPPKTE